MSNIIEIRKLNVFTSQNKAILEDIDCVLESGTTTALIGASGSGKSITAAAIMGLISSSLIVKGSILLNGRTELLTLSDKDWNKVRGNEISMIFQEPMTSLNPLITCGQQLLEAITTHQKIERKDAYQKALEWMRKVKLGDVEVIFSRYPHELSGGQKQRIVIAIAMCNYPQLIIADEATTALDVTVQKEIIELLVSLQKAFNIAILFITHDMILAKHIADHFIFMENGKIIDKPPFEIDNKLLYKPHSQGKILLSVQNLNVDYPSKKNFLGKPTSYFNVLKNINFNIEENDILGIIGASGSGKSSLAKAILGLIPFNEGTINFGSYDLKKASKREWKEIRKKLQIVFQDPYAALNPRMTVGNLIGEIIKYHQIVRGTEQIEAEVIRLLKLVHLSPEYLSRYPHELSGGQRQRICIARALAVQPVCLILDESVAALDVIIQQQILELFIEIQQKLKLIYLFITHDMQVVKKFCNKLIVLESGEIVEHGNTIDIFNDAKHPYTQQLLASVIH